MLSANLCPSHIKVTNDRISRHFHWFQTVRNYIIAYASEEIPLLVIAVLHGSRNPRVIAAILSGRK